MMPSTNFGRDLKIETPSRLNGEGTLKIITENGVLKHLQLRIFEQPRHYESFLRGRSFHEVVDVTANVCGTCAASHQMSAVHALENALHVSVTPQIRTLRRLFYCAEWLASHAQHIFLMHLPDFLGFASATEMASRPKYRSIIERGLRLKSIGGRLRACIGGGDPHPVSPCVGGFFRAPRHWELLDLRDDLAWAMQAALDTVTWVNGLNYPQFSHDYEFVSLSHPDEYPLNEGRVVSSRGLNIAIEEFEEHFAEEKLPDLRVMYHQRYSRGGYLVGPLARLNLNHQKLMPQARKALDQTSLTFPFNNPFNSIVARAIEMLHAIEEALHIIDNYKMPVPCRVSVQPEAGRGCHLTESPRGLLYHRYRLNSRGRIEDAHVWAPTAQNLKQIETDLHAFLPTISNLPVDQATLRCEQLVRNYNPCISCATNYLKLKFERR